MTRFRVPAVALSTLGLLVGCSASPATELSRRVQEASRPDGYRVNVTISAPSTIFGCFPDGGTLTIDVADEAISVYDDPDDDPVLIAEGADIALRPSAFSSGPDRWWTIEASTGAESVRGVAGPVVAALALGDDGDRPEQMIARLAGTATRVERIDSDRFRIIDRSSDPTIIDVSLDAHDHLDQLAVAAEDPQRDGRADTTQVGYTARYLDRAEPPRFRPGAVNRVDPSQLDALDTRPGACDPVVAP